MLVCCFDVSPGVVAYKLCVVCWWSLVSSLSSEVGRGAGAQWGLGTSAAGTAPSMQHACVWGEDGVWPHTRVLQAEGQEVPTEGDQSWGVSRHISRSS